MKYISKLIIFISFLTLVSCSSFRESNETNVKFYYYIDSQGDLTLENIFELNKENKLIPGSVKLNLGYTVSSAWTYMEVPNPEIAHIILFENAHLDNITIYCFNNETLLKEITGGDNKPFNYRSLENNYPNFIFPEKTNRIYMKIKTEGPFIAPITIYPAKKFAEFLQEYNFIIGLYFGFIILILVSFIIIYLWTGESLNLYYASLILLSGFITLIDLGYLFQFVWPTHPELNNKIVPFLYLSEFYLLIYVDKVLEIRRSSRILKYIFNSIYISIPFFAIITLTTPYEFAIKIVIYAGTIIPLIALFSIIYLFPKNKTNYFKFMLAGITAYLASASIYVLTVSGVISYNLITGLILQIGTGIQVIFFNLSILSKIKTLTEEKEAIMIEQNKILSESNKELKKVNQDLDDFIYTASHDLRVPLANIQGLNNALKEIEIKNTSKSNELNEIIRMIDSSLSFQEKTIMALTNISKIQRLKELNIQEVYLKDIIDNSLNQYKDLIKNFNATINIMKKEFPTIHFSETNCQSIVNAIIKNSLLYRSKERQLEITIDYIETDDYTILIIEDNGVGIRKGYEDKVFGLFTRLNTSSEGSGLGLYIAKQIMVNYDGKIEYESEYGQWTKFKIFFSKNISKTT